MVRINARTSGPKSDWGFCHDGGFTLLEIAVVLFMMSILSTIAIVRFSGSQSGAVRSAAQRIVSDVYYAQEIAKQNNKGTEVRFIQSSTPPRRCFVASACYGPESRLTGALRGLRDKILVNYRSGRAFVGWYYRNGPCLADVVSMNPQLKQAAQTAILPLALLSMPFAEDANAFGGGGGGGGGSGSPNTYQILYQDGTVINNPQGGQSFVVPLGDQVAITSGNRTIRFDSSGKLSVVSYSWSGDQTSMVLVTLNDDVDIYIARQTGKIWVQ